MNNNQLKSYSITSEESRQIDEEYEISEILINLRKALLKVGDINISEAISKLSSKTRFSFQLNNYLSDCYGQF
jgi:hypothetical protein